MARKTHDEAHEELEHILTEMLDRDEDISARAVVRLHSKLSNASAITRSESRKVLVETYRERQRKKREWAVSLKKKAADSAADELAKRDREIVELKSDLRALVESHVAMLTAIMEAGGMSKLDKFYQKHKEVRARLEAMRAMPPDSVVPLPSKKPLAAKEKK